MTNRSHELVTCVVKRGFGVFSTGERAGFTESHTSILERGGFVERVEPFRETSKAVTSAPTDAPASRVMDVRGVSESRKSRQKKILTDADGTPQGEPADPIGEI